MLYYERRNEYYANTAKERLAIYSNDLQMSHYLYFTFTKHYDLHIALEVQRLDTTCGVPPALAVKLGVFAVFVVFA